MSDAVRYVVRKFWGLCAALLIALAVLVQLGRVFAYNLGNYRDDLAAYLSDALGVAAELRMLSGEWEGLSPSVRLEGLQVQSATGEEMFTIDRVVARLDLLGSLTDWRLVWGNVELHGMQAIAEQQADGRWQIKGIDTSTALGDQEGGFAAIDDPFDVFLLGPHIELTDVRVNFSFHSGHSTQWTVPHILMENAGDFHRLGATLDVDEHHDAVSLVFEGRGDPRDREAFQVSGHLKVQQLATEKVLALLGGSYWQGLPDQSWRPGGRLDVEAWLSSRSGGGLNLEGELVLTGLPVKHEKGVQLPRSVTSEFGGFWNSAGGWRVDLQDTQVAWGKEPLPSLDLSIGAGGMGKPLEIRARQLDLAVWYQQFEKAGLVQGRLATVLGDLNPSGTVSNMRLTLPANSLNAWRLQANLNQVSVEAWKAAPALTQVDGYLQVHARSGFVELDSQSGFSMHYPLVYHEPMHYRSVKGQVAWSLQPENNAIYVNSGPIRFEDDDGGATGFVYLYTPWRKKTAAPEMFLQIGLQNSKARYYKKYVPFTVADSLEQWLDQSLGEGLVPEAGFIYRGSLRKGEHDKRTVQLSLKVADAELNYHPRWPGLKQLQGQVYVDDVDVSAHVDSGRLYNSRLNNTQVVVVPNPKGQGSLLGVRGQVQGGAADGLRVLRESMLRDTLGDTFDQWQLSGDMRADITLSVPLHAGAPGAQQQVVVKLDNSELSMANLGLDVKALKGQFEYNGQQGLMSKRLSGQLWQHPVSVRIASEANAKGGRDTLVNLSGTVATDDLALWTRRPEVYFAEGDVSYIGQLRIPSGLAQEDYAAWLNISSDLRGVTLNLPAPFGKSADKELPFQLKVPIAREQTLYDLRLGRKAKGLISVRDGEFQRGVVALGGEPVLPEDNRLSITGQVDRLDFKAWQDVWQRYKEFRRQIDEAIGEDAIDSDSDTFPQSVDLDVGTFQFGDYALDRLSVQGEHTGGQWRLLTQSPMLAGEVTVYDDERPLSLALDYLRLPKPAQSPINHTGEPESVGMGDSESSRVAEVVEQTPESALGDDNPGEADPLENIDFSEMLAVDFSTREFVIGEDNFGQWNFQLRPTDAGLEVKNIEAEVRGTRIGGLPQKEGGASLLWLREGDKRRTRFQGRLTAEDLSKVMRQWQQPEFIESRRASFDVDFAWQGSPAAIALDSLHGDLTMRVEEGRFIRSAGVGSSAFLRLMSLFNFDTLVRRLRLDFSDVYKSGMAYDDIRGKMRFEGGELYLSEPLDVKTPSGKLQMAGMINLKAETMDTTMVATLPVGENLTLLTALAAGLPAAAGVYVASKLFSRQVDKVASVSYTMSGPWADPEIEFERMFDSGAAKKTAKSTREAEAKARQDSADKSAEDNGDAPPATESSEDSNLPADGTDSGLPEPSSQQENMPDKSAAP